MPPIPRLSPIPVCLLGLLLAPACDPDEPADDDALTCTAALSDAVTTMIQVSWTAPEGATSWVEFGVGGTTDQVTPSQDGTAVAFDLVGVPSLSEVTWRGVSEVEGVRQTCEGTLSTGNLPADLPGLELVVDEPEKRSSEAFFLGSFYCWGPTRPYLMAMNRAGQVVWYAAADDSSMVVDVQFADDGDGLLFNQTRVESDQYVGEIRRIDLHNTDLERISAPNGHHVFRQLPDGTLTYLQMAPRPLPDPESGEMVDWYGDAIAEIPPGGEAEVVFSVWDWLDPAEWVDPGVSSIYDGVDWTHANAVQYAPEIGRYLLSLGGVTTILEIDRATGTPVRSFGGTHGYQTADPVDGFNWQHDPHWAADGTLLMYSRSVDGQTCGIRRYAVSDEDQLLVPIFTHLVDLNCQCLGQVRELANGNYFVNHGCDGVVEEITPEHEVVWQVTTDLGAGFSQLVPISSLYGE